MEDLGIEEAPMKAVILAGGKGTRIAEESRLRPKPMVEIGGFPILWHIMKTYEKFGVNEFVICCGYKGHMIKDFFLNYTRHRDDVMIGLKDGSIHSLAEHKEKWKVTLVDTGYDTLTAGRIKKIKEYVGEEPFFLTYGDGVSDVDLDKLLEFHKLHHKAVTISVTKPFGRFGGALLDENTGGILGFREKAREDQSWVNMGYMVMEPEVFDYLGDGSEMLEAGPFERLVDAGQLNGYRHEGFWSPMDNIHDRDYLEDLWKKGTAPWV